MSFPDATRQLWVRAGVLLGVWGLGWGAALWSAARMTVNAGLSSLQLLRDWGADHPCPRDTAAL